MESYHNEIEDKIRTYISKITNTICTTPLEVTYNNGVWVLSIGLGSKDAKPLSLGYQGDELGFIQYVCNEIRKRRLHLIHFNTSTLINRESNQYYPIIEL